MRKILILAYDFPPFVSVGGLRPYNWHQYFSENDLYPIVVTRQWENKFGNELDYVAAGSSLEVIVEESLEGRILRTPYSPNLSNRLLLKHGPTKYRLVRKVITGIFEVLQFHFNVGPKVAIYKTAKDYLRSNEVDLIIATGDPFVLFRYASKLSDEFDVPWIADYRDPWSQGLVVKKKSLLSLLQRFNEKRFVTKASMITTVDELFRTKIKTIFPDHRIEIIPNGYDPKAVQDASSVNQKNDKLRFALVGTIYKWHPIRHFLETFKTFLDQVNAEEVEIHFIGTNINEELQQCVHRKI
jgi:glycosyltransferase involved in cell wall biosynthesis